MKKVFLIIGIPATGKSWVCEQSKEKFDYVPKDDFMKLPPHAYVDAISKRAKASTRPILAEANFSISEIKEPLEALGLEVVPVFILESEALLQKRWNERGVEKESTRQGHLTRQKTYAQRARKDRAFSGTSSEVFRFLKELPL